MNTDILSRNKGGIFSRAKKDQHEESADALAEEDAEYEEGKVKTKLLSMWYNMKYGWTVKMKTNFSKDSPVWLLGRCYHRKPAIPVGIPLDQEACMSEEEGIEGFKSDFITRIWLTYRREIPVVNGSNFTTDCGWGCMLRSGQMLLAQALVLHFLGRDWRWNPDINITTGKQHQEYINHRKIIKWFGDTPSHISPFSIHSMVALGEACGKKAGDWYGPAAVAHILRRAVESAGKEMREFDNLTVYVAQDCAVYIPDVIDQCEESLMWNDISSGNTDSKGPSSPSWKSLILLVPVKLGVEKMNLIYGPCLKAVLSLENCIGIIGGRPKHSLYFVGYQDDKLIHLDPHYCQEMVNVWQPDFPLSSFHCRSPRKMNLAKLDPSCCIAFYCSTRNDFEKFLNTVQEVLIPPHEKSEYPMFVFCNSRSSDAVPFTRVNIPDDSADVTDGNVTDDDLESEEFEVI